MLSPSSNTCFRNPLIRLSCDSPLALVRIALANLGRGKPTANQHSLALYENVSTPHCLVVVAEGTFCVQDLMSERGTYLQRLGSGTFAQVSDIVEVHHGDRLKFGDYEVMVCLLLAADES